METIELALSELSRIRPCFHSEADFQFALAWQVKTMDPRAEVRLEIPQSIGSRTYKLDLLFRANDRRIAVEVKYYKAPLATQLSDEPFSLIDAVAHDIHRYDFL